MFYPNEHAGVMWVSRVFGAEHPSAVAVVHLLEKYPVDSALKYTRTDPAAEAVGLREAIAVLEEKKLAVPVVSAVLEKLDRLAGEESTTVLEEFSGAEREDQPSPVEEDAEDSASSF